jgi:hypothetical protein
MIRLQILNTEHASVQHIRRLITIRTLLLSRAAYVEKYITCQDIKQLEQGFLTLWAACDSPGWFMQLFVVVVVLCHCMVKFS